MNEKSLKKELGNCLKDIRKDKKISAKSLGDSIGYSQSHISGIENGIKTMPTESFIRNYLLGITKNTEELKDYYRRIADITNNKINLDGVTYLKNGEASPDEILNLTDDLMSGIKNPFSIVENNKTGRELKSFNFPINDIFHHLSDIENPKYFRKIVIDDDDRIYINDLINNYFIQKINVQINEIKRLLDREIIDKEKANNYLNELVDLKKQLKNPNSLKYE
ncbi:helix-turn-helix domain-containing protein [Mammaliicoccus sciuri]|uniref:helix-turn-helix domain-containing protein n=1 Tax=Mammaliicoccus sciuri TaxID=1296 RepID=UPI001FB3FB83|nr:helix-turn-helix transcriptional regulator [Mammaliicoccus sciuri]MCJ0956419.1 helix-turn-helix domain-containing protein [Mammaliicoccus sciuri]MCJ1775081.1 helix-turn-helix domain-containing protein [Mammaliicoccus sciuri]